MSSAREAAAAPRPYVVFVTGKQLNSSTTPLRDRAPTLRDWLRSTAMFSDAGSATGAEVWSTSWNCFQDGANEWSSPSAGSPATGCPSNDANFLQDLGNFLNAMPQGRRVILIGHSFGGDSLLKAVNGADGIARKVNRPITALVTLDPTSTAGHRRTNEGFYGNVSSSAGMKLFFNRWQENDVPPYLPFNSWDDGHLNLSSGGCTGSVKCDEERVDYQRDGSGNILRYDPPPCFWGWNPNLNCGTFGCAGGPQLYCPDGPPKLASHSTISGEASTGGQFVQKQLMNALKPFLSGRIVTTIKSTKNGMFLRAQNQGGSQLFGNSPWAADWESFEIMPDASTFTYGGTVGIAATSGHFVRSAPESWGFTVTADSPWKQGWETFKIESYYGWGGAVRSGDIVYLRDWQGRYLKVNADQTMTSTPVRDDSCVFQLNFSVKDAPSVPNP